MRILQVSAVDDAGGAAKVARKLFENYRSRGEQSWLAVGVKRSVDRDVVQIQHAPAAVGWGRPWWRLHDAVRRHSGRLSKATAHMASPNKILDEWNGVENFDYPGTRRLLNLTPAPPQVLHLHNVHGFFGFFDLRQLIQLSDALPVVVTLHDSWMFTGHCAVSFDCNRWRQGCGSCPYLDTYPAVRRDRTNLNWQRKREIYRNSSLYVSAPSQWLLNQATASILSDGIVEARVISNGVDLLIFRPGDKVSARQRIGLPLDGTILVFSGLSPSTNPFKDFPTLRAAAEILGSRPDRGPITLVVLGESGAGQRIGSLTIRFAGYVADERDVATYYQAADVYVHASRAESQGLTLIEALACGIPVVATAVGGIPEVVKSFSPFHDRTAAEPSVVDDATGILTPPGDAHALADAVDRLIQNKPLLQALSLNAAADARQRFSLDTQADAYIGWYREITDREPLISEAKQ